MITMLAHPVQSLRRYLLDRMVLRPSRGLVDHGLQRREVLNVHGEKIECFVHSRSIGDQPPDWLVLKFPGTAGRAERSSEFPISMVNSMGGEVWTWNPPGYGGSSGRPSLTKIARSAEGFARTVLSEHAPTATRLWLVGNSLGCNTALHVASTLDDLSLPVGLVLRNPPPLIPVVQRIAQRYPLGKLVGPIAESLTDSMNALSLAPMVDRPAVFLQCLNDSLVPPSIQNEVIRRYAGNHQVVKLAGLDHDGIATDEQAETIRSAIQWLWKQTNPETI
ncbi:Alpha/beta hydrolase family protein [Rubripirellula lacrimiformis]|uniref:Alpha/beta hydrolase family protein n=1 Tax=Rubripirellula lacrimiformis TaxID=1930273 RepID=A0A517N9B2_9BACT|nr:alpha/beta hydrolase [Rubripirellula lacrimiformis]QDT03721.1 Alpha/beta hydrolase family protein [Rubripirellula lacrimiformis]